MSKEYRYEDNDINQYKDPVSAYSILGAFVQLLIDEDKGEAVHLSDIFSRISKTRAKYLNEWIEMERTTPLG